MSTATDLQAELFETGKAAREASRALAKATTEQKDQLLAAIADQLDQRREEIAVENEKDLVAGRENGLNSALLDRLELNEKRIAGMIQGLRDVIDLEDPVGSSLREWTLPSGVDATKVRVPIGVIGIIFESRPNVTVDASALCLKTGNAVILRGGKEAIHSNKLLARIMQDAAEQAGIPRAVVSLVQTVDREAIKVMCEMDQYLDLLIPRGGHGLIQAVVSHARMPVIKHYNGICHVYVHEKADADMAESIVVNAKTQRPGVCNALETLLVDKSIAQELLPRLAKALHEKEVELFMESDASSLLHDTLNGSLGGKTFEAPESWEIEYLDLKLSVRIVDGIDAAIDHINSYGSAHSDCIVTSDEASAEKFLQEIDSATVYWNASTRFTDGAEFGFGAEIGISTDKIHARGPMALEELTSYKYLLRGTGQIKG